MTDPNQQNPAAAPFAPPSQPMPPSQPAARQYPPAPYPGTQYPSAPEAAPVHQQTGAPLPPPTGSAALGQAPDAPHQQTVAAPEHQQQHPQQGQQSQPASGLPADGLSPADLARAKVIVDRMAVSFARKVVGQQGLRTSIMVALVAGGHIMLESVPGLAKSTAANTLAESVQAEFRRIQCTPDLLPSDIIGTQIYDAANGKFQIQLGPVHANIVLLDEINRSSAKTQSAMLESMQERQTTIGGTIYKLPSPFLVIATQNPIEQEGTYLLPEAQLDRFLLKEVLDYPTAADEYEILQRIDSGVFDAGNETPDPLSLDDVRFLQDAASRVFVEESVRHYLITIVQATRRPADFIAADLARLVDYGGSPRASIAFLQAARALALLQGRAYVIPEDVKSMAHRVLRHRVVLNFEADALDISPERVIDAIVGAIPTP